MFLKVFYLDPDPYGHFRDPGSRSAKKLIRIQNTNTVLCSRSREKKQAAPALALTCIGM